MITDPAEFRAACAPLKPQHVCEAAGVDWSTYWRWERGDTDMRLSTIERLNNAIPVAKQQRAAALRAEIAELEGKIKEREAML